MKINRGNRSFISGKNAFYRIMVIILLTAMRAVMPGGSAAAQNNWPTPYVALFDCNISDAEIDSSYRTGIINSASKYILTNILSDSSSRQVFLFSYGFADTTSTDMSVWETSFPLPDSVDSFGTGYDYVIESKISGVPGAYKLTVSIEDGRTYVHVADGTASFLTVSYSEIESASYYAVKQILPLTTKIMNYQESLKAGNPLLVISPRIEVTPEKLILPADGSTGLTFTMTDCDGVPLANRELFLESNLGSLSPTTVVTDDRGSATAVFNAGDSAGTSILTATFRNAVTVMHDTSIFSGQASLILGTIDTTNIWTFEFDMKRSRTSCNDKITKTISGDGAGTQWSQKNGFWVQSAHGRIFARARNKDNTEFTFLDSAMSVTGEYRLHNFSKTVFLDTTGNVCPKTFWEMSGLSQTYVAKADTEDLGSATFSYDPLVTDEFNLSIPYVNIDAYGYDWKTKGEWGKGGCHTTTVTEGQRLKWFNSKGGITVYGQEPIPGFTILPYYSDGKIIRYLIIFNSSGEGYLSDGSYYFEIIKCTGTLSQISSITGIKAFKPEGVFILSQNYPNPFNPSTTIRYELPFECKIKLKIYDLLGQEVRELENGTEAAGYHEIKFNAGNLSSGIYFYRIAAESSDGKKHFQDTKKFILLK